MVELRHTNDGDRSRRNSVQPPPAAVVPSKAAAGFNDVKRATQSRHQHSEQHFGARDSGYSVDNETPPRLFARGDVVPLSSTTVQLIYIEKQRMVKYAQSIAPKTLFQTAEIVRLIRLMQPYLSAPTYKMEKGRFKDFLTNYLGMSSDLGMDRLFREFDRDSDSYLNLTEFVEGMSVLLLGTSEQRKVLAFMCNDRQRRGYFDRMDIATALAGSLDRLLPEDRDAFGDEDYESDLIELTMRKLDVNNDGKVSWSDWQTTVRRDPLMLKCLCSLFPDPDKRLKFLHVLGVRFSSYLFAGF